MPAPYTVDDIVTVGSIRWIIRRIDGDNVTLAAANVEPGITWNTTLSNLPTPIKEQAR